jgi:hypothetical protein
MHKPEFGLFGELNQHPRHLRGHGQPFPEFPPLIDTHADQEHAKSPSSCAVMRAGTIPDMAETPRPNRLSAP